VGGFGSQGGLSGADYYREEQSIWRPLGTLPDPPIRPRSGALLDFGGEPYLIAGSVCNAPDQQDFVGCNRTESVYKYVAGAEESDGSWTDGGRLNHPRSSFALAQVPEYFLCP